MWTSVEGIIHISNYLKSGHGYRMIIGSKYITADGKFYWKKDGTLNYMG